MSIAEFIRESVLRPRLKQAGALVVYDADRRYREQCFDLAGDKVRVVDTSESSIESREAALLALREVGHPQKPVDGVLIYVPRKRPETDEEKQSDPFALYAECGAVFPQDDGDEYLSLCLRARPDHATEIRRLFSCSDEIPGYAMIDAIDSGRSWPLLSSSLNVTSPREILVAIMSPKEEHRAVFEMNSVWISEAHEFLIASVGCELKTRMKTHAAVADELWRFMLFSEFAFDLPVSLPPSLSNVPRAPIEAKPIVEDVCETLRNQPQSRGAYTEKARAIERDLDLVATCRDIQDLGSRDTFPFEERTFLRRALDGIASDSLDETRRIVSERAHSVWLDRGDCQTQWAVVRALLSLAQACDRHEATSTDLRSQKDIIDHYINRHRELDRLYREYEQADSDFADITGMFQSAVVNVVARYRRLNSTLHRSYLESIACDGWPPTGIESTDQLFDTHVAPILKERGGRVAYIMVDALRYELGLALKAEIEEVGAVTIGCAYTQLPTITPVGMASLLPQASKGTKLEVVNDSIVPVRDGTQVATVTQRMNVFKEKYGDRFQHMQLKEFLQSKTSVDSIISLLVLRTTEIDTHLESNSDIALALVPQIIRTIRASLHRLKELGFSTAVIVTDHGFQINPKVGPGDACAKPQGVWAANVHDRMLFGTGLTDESNIVYSAKKLGIKGDFEQVAVPRAITTYRSGVKYFHGGISLAEVLVPILTVGLTEASAGYDAKYNVELSYKKGARNVTTRLPVIEIVATGTDLFASREPLEIQLEAYDCSGSVVGELRPNADVNPTTRTVSLAPGVPKQLAIHMAEDFRGEFAVRALNPITLALASPGSELQLFTDYTE